MLRARLIRFRVRYDLVVSIRRGLVFIRAFGQGVVVVYAVNIGRVLVRVGATGSAVVGRVMSALSTSMIVVVPRVGIK